LSQHFITKNAVKMKQKLSYRWDSERCRCRSTQLTSINLTYVQCTTNVR